MDLVLELAAYVKTQSIRRLPLRYVLASRLTAEKTETEADLASKHTANVGFAVNGLSLSSRPSNE